MSFRDNLQHLRSERHMTQEQLAMLLGVSRQSVTKWESEKAYPEMDKLLKICQIFECTLDDLVTGDLTGVSFASTAVSVPVGPAQDICGYDEHKRRMARFVPLGIAIIIAGIGLSLYVEADPPIMLGNDPDTLFIMCLFISILAGLALLIPAGMENGAFIKAHPFIEDFYTEDDKAQARKIFTKALLGGIGMICIALLFLIAWEGSREGVTVFFLLVAVGVWLIVRYTMLWNRTNISEYNRAVVDTLEIEEIAQASIDEQIRSALLEKKHRSKRLGAICGIVMIIATICGLCMLFIPVLSAPNPDTFQPEGTPTMWFWLAWPIGALVCGIVALLFEACGKRK